MNTDVTAKMGRRRGARREHPLYGAATDEQRSRRPIFAITLRAEGLLNLFFVTRQSRIHADTARLIAFSFGYRVPVHLTGVL